MSEMQTFWPDILETLLAGNDLSESTASDAMRAILVGDVSPAQIAGLLVAMRAKGPAITELVGFVRAMQDASEHVPLDDETVIDTCGTGGDGHKTINISTLAAIVVAGAGGKVCKHGNRAVSSDSGSADLLEALDVKIDLSPQQVADSVEDIGIGFCFAPSFHLAMRHVAPIRKELGIATVFNILGPLCNPARVRRQLLGVPNPDLARQMAEVLEGLGHVNSMVVSSRDGLDEISTCATTDVIHLIDGETREFQLDPKDYGLACDSLDKLKGGNAVENAEHAMAVLGGNHGPHRDVVVLNAGAGLVVAGRASSIEEGILMSQQAIDDGSAANVLKKWQTKF